MAPVFICLRVQMFTSLRLSAHLRFVSCARAVLMRGLLQLTPPSRYIFAVPSGGSKIEGLEELDVPDE